MATAANPNNIRLGPCLVNWGGNDLGYTKGGVEVDITSDTHQTEVDQLGNVPVNEWLLGRTVSVKAPLVETTVDRLSALLAASGATLSADKTALTVTTGVGLSLRAGAQPLILHPQSLPETDKSEDFTIPLANTAGSLTFSYKIDDERVFEITFTGYPDANGVLFIYGGAAA